jgi:hypothetical protein
LECSSCQNNEPETTLLLNNNINSQQH